MRRHARTLFVVFALSALSLATGCQPPERGNKGADGAASPHVEGGASGSTTLPPPITSLPDGAEASAATMVGVELGAWGRAPMHGNFATLTVEETGIGKPLTIESLEVDVVVEGRMARTQVTQVFRNHLGRQTEGTYAFTLPPGAAINRLAMDVEGVMTEGELVERERARRIYEEIVSRKRDPALLEFQGGNRFKTQIFPIPPRGTKTVILSYEQLLPENRDGVHYDYALPHLQGDVQGTRIDRFAFKLTAATTRPVQVASYGAKVERMNNVHVIALERQSFVPEGPIDVHFGPAPSREPVLLQGYKTFDDKRESFFLVDFVPALAAKNEASGRNLVVAVDTSAGIGDLVLAQAKVAAMLLINALPSGSTFQIVYGDFRIAACSETPWSVEQKGLAAECLEKLDAGGATDLLGLVERAALAAKTMDGPTNIVLLTDGTASMGELDGDVIKARLKEALAGSDTKLHAVSIGHAAAEADLAALAASGRGHALRMSPADGPAVVIAELLARANEPMLTDVHVEVVAGEVEGLTPAAPINLARGEGLAVLGKVLSESATLKVRGLYGGEVYEQTVGVKVDANAPESMLLTNFWARAAIGAREAAGDKIADLVATSLKYGVMSQHTSFLVLENDEAFKRFEVERRKEEERARRRGPAEQTADKAVVNLKKSDADLSVVLQAAAQEAQKEEMMDAKQAPMRKRKRRRARTRRPAPAATADGAFGYDAAPAELEESELNLETTGEGKGGGGYGIADLGGRGIGHGSPPKPGSTKTVMQTAEPQVTGSLDKNIIRRVVRRHQAQIKACYEGELLSAPTLQGKVVVSWVINPQGEVVSAVVKSTTVNLSRLESCITKAVMRWRFPAPTGGGIVKVTYPFAFSTGADAPAPPTPKERIAALEKEETPGIGDFAELMVLYLDQGDDEKAKAAFEKHWARFEQEPTQSRIAVFAHPKAIELFSAQFETVALQAAKEGDLASAQALLERYLTSARYDELVKSLGSVHIPSTDAARRMLASVAGKNGPAAGQLLSSWAQLMAPGELVAVVDDPVLLELAPRGVFDAAAAWFKAADPDPVYPHDKATNLLISSAKAIGKEGEAIGILGKQCLARFDRATCTAAIRRFEGHPSVEPTIANLVSAELAAVAEARRSDVGNPDMIRRHADLLRETGKREEASRVLSEIVEFAPHDYGLRVRYAQELENENAIDTACMAYATAVQLDPSQRDTFRTMMRMRRTYEDHAKSIKSCIVQGVSNLPVRRAISLVMTWEDPTADVDMHIVEAGGEEVWFQDRESGNGGLLYYDITDGYGPEIYVLGSGPTGSYELSVVYYSGSTQNLKGTLTVMENAGSPEETRREIPFTLPSSDPNTKIPLGKLAIQ